MVPEQYNSKRFKAVLDDKNFRQLLVRHTIDEAHLVDTWGGSFRCVYLNIGPLHLKLDSSVVLVGMTATLKPGRSQKLVLDQLGFTGRSNTRMAPLIFRMPIDRPSLKMSSRLLQHGLGGHTFPDLYFVLPIFTGMSPYPEIERRIIACGTIGLANRVIEFLDRQLPSDYPDRLRKIMPYHLLMSVEY